MNAVQYLHFILSDRFEVRQIDDIPQGTQVIFRIRAFRPTSQLFLGVGATRLLKMNERRRIEGDYLLSSST